MSVLAIPTKSLNFQAYFFLYIYYSMLVLDHVALGITLNKHDGNDRNELGNLKLQLYLNKHELLHYFGVKNHEQVPAHRIVSINPEFARRFFHYQEPPPSPKQDILTNDLRIDKLKELKENIKSVQSGKETNEIGGLDILDLGGEKEAMAITTSTHNPSSKTVSQSSTTISTSSILTNADQNDIKRCPDNLEITIHLPSSIPPEQIRESNSSTTNRSWVFDVERNRDFVKPDFLSFEIRGNSIIPLDYTKDDIRGTTVKPSPPSVPPLNLAGDNKPHDDGCFYTGVGNEIELPTPKPGSRLQQQEYGGEPINKIFDSSYSSPIFPKDFIEKPFFAGSPQGDLIEDSSKHQDPMPSRAFIAFDLLNKMNGLIKIVNGREEEFYVIQPLQSHINDRIKLINDRKRTRRIKRNLHFVKRRNRRLALNNFIDLNDIHNSHLIYKLSSADPFHILQQKLGTIPNIKDEDRRSRRALLKKNDFKVKTNKLELKKEKTTPLVRVVEPSSASPPHQSQRNSKPVFEWSKQLDDGHNLKWSNNYYADDFDVRDILDDITADERLLSAQHRSEEEDIINTIHNNIHANEDDEYFQQAFYPKSCSVNKYYNDTITEEDMRFIKDVDKVLDLEPIFHSHVEQNGLNIDPEIGAGAGHLANTFESSAGRNKNPLTNILSEKSISKFFPQQKQLSKTNLNKNPKKVFLQSQYHRPEDPENKNWKNKTWKLDINTNSSYNSEAQTNIVPPLNRPIKRENKLISPPTPEQSEKRTADFATPVLELAGFLDQELIRLKIERNRMNVAEIRNQYISLFHFVHLLYLHSSIGRPIKINLVRLYLMTSNPPTIPSGNSYIRSLIMQFSRYQYSLNGQKIWDNSVLLTGNDLFDLNGMFVERRVIGYGFYGRFICDPFLSVSLNEGMDGFGAAITITHEMGHNFGMDHDNLNNGCDRRRFIMAESLGIGQVTWSPCSATVVTTNSRLPEFSCLFTSRNTRPLSTNNAINDDIQKKSGSVPQTVLNSPGIEEGGGHNIFTDRILPGLLYDIHEQCRSFNGPSSAHDERQNLETICQFVECTNTISRFYRFPALEGTICGPGKWCKGGLCIAQSNITVKYRQEHGWTPWYLSVPCTSLCLKNGIGIEEFRRICLSSSEFQSDECSGDAVRYNLCEQICPEAKLSVDSYIATKCLNGSLYQNTIVLNGQGFQKSFNQNNLAEPCRIYCNYDIIDGVTVQKSSAIIKAILPTGTRCNSLPKMYCVKGICQQVNVLDPFKV